jgi:hypothetical protein
MLNSVFEHVIEIPDDFRKEVFRTLLLLCH